MKKCVLTFYFVFGVSCGVMAQSIPKTAYVLNSLGQNLSLINLQNGNVNLDALPLGQIANVIKIRREKAYVINSGVNELQMINLNPLSTIGRIDVGNGTNPWNLDFVNDSVAVVSLWATNPGKVAIVNINNGQVINQIMVGTTPQGVKYTDGKIYVANSGFVGIGMYEPGTISVIDASSFVVIDTINVGLNPQDLDVDSQDHLIVVCSGDYVSAKGQMDIVNLNTGELVNAIPFTSSPTSVGINSQDQCYIATYGSGVMVYNLSTESFEREESNPLPGGPGIDFDAQNNVYITDFGEDSVRVFSPSHQKIAAYLVGDGPASIGIYDPPVTNIELTNPSKPDNFKLYQNYPNPFNPSTTIKYDLSEAGIVHLEIFNLLGEKIRTLIAEKQPPGVYQVEWDGRDDTNSIMPSGIYFYRLGVDGFSKINKMYLIR